MVTILLQKILDLLKENLSNMIKFFITDPQDGQTLVYDAESEEWKNDYVEIELQETAAGSVATFETEATFPLVSLKANITATQSGTGTPSPSNPRSISGFDIVNLTRCGKNLFKTSLGTQTYNGVIYTVNSDGTITLGGQATSEAIRTFHFYLPAGSYIYTSGIIEDYATYDTYITKGSSNIARGREGSNTFTLTEYSDLVFGLRVRNGVSPNITVKPMVRVSTDTDSTFVAYSGETKTIALGDTYYGGVLDVKNGTATITHEIVNMEDLNWTYNSTNQYFQVAKPSGASTNAALVCSCYKYTVSTVENLSIFQTGSYFRVQDTNYTDAQAFKTAVTGQKICYGLATPITLSGLTPDNFTTIAGENNIFTDSGDVEVIYNTSSAQKVWDVSNLNIDISSSVTVNTTDFSSVSYKIIRSGNVVMISLYSATVVNSYPEALFSGLPKGYNNANVVFIDTVSGDIVPGFLTTTGYLNAANAQTDQKIGALITYITKDEV